MTETNQDRAQSSEKQERKVIFRLEKDEDDYPPNDYEGLWATPVENGHYSVDNIPFFVRDISPGDIISIKDEEGKLFFDSVVAASTSSVIRVIVYDEGNVPMLRDSLHNLGCETEQSHIANLISVEIGQEVDFDTVTHFLNEGENRDEWEYETASIRHE